MFSHDTNCFCIFSVVQCLVLWGQSQTSALAGNKKHTSTLCIFMNEEDIHEKLITLKLQTHARVC